jgi:hypothetical protein
LPQAASLADNAAAGLAFLPNREIPMRSSLSLFAALLMGILAAGCSESKPSAGGAATVAEAGEEEANADEDAAEQTADAEPAEDEPPVDPLEQVRADISAGDLDKALAAIDAATAASADNEMMVLSTRYALATMLHRAGRSEEAFAQHTKAAEGFLALLADDPAMETRRSTSSRRLPRASRPIETMPSPL